MKKYIPSILFLFAAGAILTSCDPGLYAQRDYGNYDNGYGYDNGYDNSYGYDNGYNNYDYNQYGNGGGGLQISFNDFYSQLAPYGRWVMDPSYGRVWVANVQNFQPYATNGYWTYTNYGWTWVSNYDWGWAPFHYGRWGFSNINGWFWVPGYEWAPAWVGWSSSADMYGWAPLGPGMSLGVNISIGSFPVNYWTFMPRRYMGYRNIYSYYTPRSRYSSIIRRANVVRNYRSIRNTRYAMGPQPREVSRSTGRAVRTTRIVNANSSRNTGLRNNELLVYRPAVRGSNTGNRTNPASNRTSTPSRAGRPNVAPRSSGTPSRAQRSTQQRAAQQRASQQRAAQQRASQQRAAQQRAAQQRAQKAAQRAQQQRTQRAQRTQQRVERVQQRSQSRSSNSRGRATRSRR